MHRLMNARRASTKRAIMALVAIAIPGCSTVAHRSPVAEGERLMQLSREWSRAAATGDVDAVVRYWADDAVVMMAGLPTFRGREAIRGYVRQSFAIPGFRISWEPLEVHVSAAGDMAYLIERTEVTLPGADGRLATHHSRAVSIWRRGADDRWRNALDISNAEAQAPDEG